MVADYTNIGQNWTDIDHRGGGAECPVTKKAIRSVYGIVINFYNALNALDSILASSCEDRLVVTLRISLPLRGVGDGVRQRAGGAYPDEHWLDGECGVQSEVVGEAAQEVGSRDFERAAD